MKLKEGFITHATSDEHLTISTNGAFNGIVRSNPSAAFIVECLKEEITEQEIIQRMLKKYDAPSDIIEEDVKKILDILRGIKALDE